MTVNKRNFTVRVKQVKVLRWCMGSYLFVLTNSQNVHCVHKVLFSLPKSSVELVILFIKRSSVDSMKPYVERCMKSK